MKFWACPFGPGKKDLSKHIFTTYQKNWFVWKSKQKKIQVKNLAEFYKLKASRIRKWIEKTNRGETLHPDKGRPPAFGEKQLKTLKVTLTGSRIKMGPKEYDKFLLDLATERAEELGKDMRNIKPPSDKTIRKIEASLGVKESNAEKTTVARAIAVEDVRNFVSFAAVASHMSQLVPKYLQMNIDSTVFPAGHQFKETVKVKTVGESKRTLKVLPQGEEKEELVVGIKAYIAITAEGRIGKPVFIVTQDGLSPENEDWVYVSELGIGVSEIAGGYIVFASSKSTTLNFLTNYHEKVLFPLVQNIRQAKEVTTEIPAWLQVDGECKHIQFYENYGVLDALTKENIWVTKSPASTTEVTQPCDNGGCFLGPKTRLKSLKLEARDINADLLEKIQKIMKKQSEKAEFTRDYIDRVSKGLVRVHYCMNLSITQQCIKNSFEECGLAPLSIEKIMKNCSGYEQLTQAEKTVLPFAIAQLSDKIAKKGELTERDLSRESIPQNVECTTTKHRRTTWSTTVDELLLSPIPSISRKNR